MKTLEKHLLDLLAPLAHVVSSEDIQNLTDALLDSTDVRIQKRLKYQPPVKLELAERRHRGEKVQINETFSVAFEKRCLLLCFNQNVTVDQATARRLNQSGISAKSIENGQTLFLMPSRDGSFLIRGGERDRSNRTTSDVWTLVPSK